MLLIEHSMSAPAASSHVLLIDDEATIRAAMRRFFARRGWQVEEAEDGQAALELLLASDREFDVVISDLRMPGLSGIELHDRLMELRPELLDRLVFSTGDVASRDAADFLERCRRPVLQKPFELSELLAVVERVRRR